MADEREIYEEWLETWEPDERLAHACLPQNAGDPFVRSYIVTGAPGTVERRPYKEGDRASMVADEEIARRFTFFKERQEEWSADFEELVSGSGMPLHKLEVYIDYFAHGWVDGYSERQRSSTAKSIKASICQLDLICSPARKFVNEEIPADVGVLFTPREMAAIFETNSKLVDVLLPDYVDHLGAEGPEALGHMYIRRGVLMNPDQLHTMRREQHYLSSYSLAIGPAEQFARIPHSLSGKNGVPCIFSAPLAAIQDRIVAFAPFVRGMPLDQLEFVVAPPVEEMGLRYLGVFSGIHEYGFK